MFVAALQTAIRADSAVSLTLRWRPRWYLRRQRV